MQTQSNYIKNSTDSIIDDAKNKIDPQSEALLQLLEEHEQIRKNRVSGVRTILVVLSSRAMVFDTESLKTQILLSYPDATVFFRSTHGNAIGPATPHRVDLLIDLTGPRERQWIFIPRSLRSMAKAAVGRNAGFFRGSYDRIFDEKAAGSAVPGDLFEKERFVQKKVLALAGVALSQKSDTPPDRGKTIALDLPPLSKL